MKTRLNAVVSSAAAVVALAIGLSLQSDPPRAGARAEAWPDAPPTQPRTATARPGPALQLSPAPLPDAAEAPASLAAKVEQLASRDTPRDAYAAFALLARCVRAREFDAYLKSLPMERGLDAQRSVYGDGQRLLSEVCSDLSMAQLVARIDLVEKAARGGVPGAASAWIEQGPFGDKSALEQRPDDPLVIEWVKQAIARIYSAAKTDDIDAIVQFGMLSLNWELSDIDRVNVLVHSATQRDLEDQLLRLARREGPPTEPRNRAPP